MDKQYIDQLWELFRKRRIGVYRFSEIPAEFLRKERTNTNYPTLHFSKGPIKVYQSHSGRSAWVYAPWKDGNSWYLGFEYKGIGENGRRVRRFARTAWGGVYRKRALAEHRFSKIAFDNGVFCQKPIAVYDYGKLYGKDLAVVIRTFTSPLRLSDFHFEPRFFKKYLEVRGETEREYCHSISSILGRNVRKLFDLGIYHGSMEINNITTEGELADFEPTNGGSWEGLRRTENPDFRYLALRRVLDAGETTFPKYTDEFNENFARAFFSRKVELSKDNPAKDIAERYCGVEIKLRESKKEDRGLNKLIKMFEKSLRKAKGRKERRLLNWILEDLKS